MAPTSRRLESMIYVKSVAAGITVVVLATLLSSLLIGLYLAYKSKQNEAIGLDLISFAKTPLAWLIVAVIFMAGFFWEFRHIKA